MKIIPEYQPSDLDILFKFRYVQKVDGVKIQLTGQGLQISNELLANLDRNGKDNKVHQIAHGNDERPNKKHKRENEELLIHERDVIDLTNETDNTIDNFYNAVPNSAPCPIIKTVEDFYIIPIGLEILPSTGFSLPKLTNEPPGFN